MEINYKLSASKMQEMLDESDIRFCSRCGEDFWIKDTFNWKTFYAFTDYLPGTFCETCHNILLKKKEDNTHHRDN